MSDFGKHCHGCNVKGCDMGNRERPMTQRTMVPPGLRLKPRCVMRGKRTKSSCFCDQLVLVARWSQNFAVYNLLYTFIQLPIDEPHYRHYLHSGFLISANPYAQLQMNEETFSALVLEVGPAHYRS